MDRASLDLEKTQVVCDHCSAMEKVLTDLVGTKVSRVIMKRVATELHSQSVTSMFEVSPQQVTVEAAPIPPIVPKSVTYQESTLGRHRYITFVKELVDVHP